MTLIYLYVYENASEALYGDEKRFCSNYNPMEERNLYNICTLSATYELRPGLKHHTHAPRTYNLLFQVYEHKQERQRILSKFCCDHQQTIDKKRMRTIHELRAPNHILLFKDILFLHCEMWNHMWPSWGDATSI